MYIHAYIYIYIYIFVCVVTLWYTPEPHSSYSNPHVKHPRLSVSEAFAFVPPVQSNARVQAEQWQIRGWRMQRSGFQHTDVISRRGIRRSRYRLFLNLQQGSVEFYKGPFFVAMWLMDVYGYVMICLLNTYMSFLGVVFIVA